MPAPCGPSPLGYFNWGGVNMELLAKFSAVEIQTAGRMTETDRQFCQRQQEAYQDVVEGFYQIAALWTDIYDRQKTSLSTPEDLGDKWKQKYLVSQWWPEVTAGAIMKHISLLHKEFIFTLVSYFNAAYHLALDTGDIIAGLLPEEPHFTGYEETVDWSAISPVVLNYEDAVTLILSWFDGRTFEEQGPHELVERCHLAAWRKRDRQPNFEQKKNLIKLLSGTCSYGYYGRHEQWHIYDSAKNILKALAYFETGALSQYPDGIDDLLFEENYLWYDLWEFDGCKKLEKIKLFKNGRMDIRFTSEGYAREFVSTYLGTVW